ncbi:MAG: hypothetical protein SGI77_28465 [Pirellulaceae bacterium]|nr:hypothetical protein [Pirellulaceae bacterium]
MKSQQKSQQRGVPQRFIRWLVSCVLVIHLFIIGLALMAHRGASYLHDDVLSFVAPYTTLGNWRMDFSPLPIASANQHGEVVRVEWHNSKSDTWTAYPVIENVKSRRHHQSLNNENRLDQMWFQQLSGLLVFDNDDGVGRMLIAAMLGIQDEAKASFDQVRITVAPRLTIEQFQEIANSNDLTKLSDNLESQVAYSASIIDLGDGQVSLLKQLEERRSSKSISQNDKMDAPKRSEP